MFLRVVSGFKIKYMEYLSGRGIRTFGEEAACFGSQEFLQRSAGGA